MLPHRQGHVERKAGMLGESLSKTLEGTPSVLIVKVVDMIEAFRRTFLELRRL
jgi:hypothetical protein